MTNFEKIRQMSVEELAEFLFMHQFSKCSNCDYYRKQCSGEYFDGKICTMGIKHYLETEGKALMIVKHKKTGKIFEVYEIKNDRCGYPNFLIYKDSQWKWMSAKHFKPCEKVGVMNDACTCNTI